MRVAVRWQVGLDVIIDEQGRPWVLEINALPKLTGEQSAMKASLLRAVLSGVCGGPALPAGAGAGAGAAAPPPAAGAGGPSDDRAAMGGAPPMIVPWDLAVRDHAVARGKLVALQ